MNQTDAMDRGNDQVVVFSLVELLTMLVFVAMALALVLHEEDVRNLNPSADIVKRLKESLSQKETKIREQSLEIAKLKEQIEDQQDFISKLLKSPPDSLPNTAGVWVSASRYALLSNDREIVKDLEADNKRLRDRLGAKTGTVILSRCEIAPGPLLIIKLLPGGYYSATAGWPASADAAVSEVAGAKQMISAGRMSEQKFSSLARTISDWGLARPERCRFAVKPIRTHGNADVAFHQANVVGWYFYASPVR